MALGGQPAGLLLMFDGEDRLILYRFALCESGLGGQWFWPASGTTLSIQFGHAETGEESVFSVCFICSTESILEVLPSVFRRVLSVRSFWLINELTCGTSLPSIGRCLGAGGGRSQPVLECRAIM